MSDYHHNETNPTSSPELKGEYAQIKYKADLEYYNNVLLQNSKIQYSESQKVQEAINLTVHLLVKMIMTVAVACIGGSALFNLKQNGDSLTMYAAWVSFILSIMSVLIALHTSLVQSSRVSEQIAKSFNDVNTDKNDEKPIEVHHGFILTMLSTASVSMVVGITLLIFSLFIGKDKTSADSYKKIPSYQHTLNYKSSGEMATPTHIKLTIDES